MRRLALPLAVLGLVLAAASAPGRAAEPGPNESKPPKAQAPSSTAPAPGTATAAAASGASTAATPGQALPLTGQLKLSLAQAISSSIQNNLAVAVERHAPLIAQENASIAWGAFDPTASADFTRANVETPTANPFITSNLTTTRTNSGDVGISGLLPKLGTNYSLTYTGSGQTSSSALNLLSPEYDSGVLLDVRQPLLRNFLWDQPWTQVQLTRIGVDTANEDFRRQLMDTVQTVEDAYWQLNAASEQLRVAEKSLETAQALLKQTKDQYQVGVVSQVEVTEAVAGVAAREVTRIQAENTYRAAQDQLIQLVYGSGLRPDTSLEIIPTDQPEVSLRQVNVDKATTLAFDHRPELASARDAINQQRVQLQYARNQRLPQFDLEATYGDNSLAGRLNPLALALRPTSAPPPNIRRNYFDTFNNLVNGNEGQQWSVGGTVSIPIGNTAGKHGVSKAELQLRQARTQERRTEQQIILDVRNAVRNLKSSLQGIDAAKRAREAAAEQLRAERVRLEHGESTPFDVLQRERDLVQAESQEIEALRLYESSVAGLDRAQGTILRNNNIVVEQAAKLR